MLLGVIMARMVGKGTCGPGLLLIFAITVGCGPAGGPDVQADEPWARAMVVSEDAGEGPSGVNSAVYLRLRNVGGAADTLLGGESPVSRRVEVHRSFMDGDVMRMREAGLLPIPPGDEVVLEPGGLHIMLLDLTESLVEGDTLSLVLEFRRTGPVSLRVPIRGPGSVSGSGG